MSNEVIKFEILKNKLSKTFGKIEEIQYKDGHFMLFKKNESEKIGEIAKLKVIKISNTPKEDYVMYKINNIFLNLDFDINGQLYSFEYEMTNSNVNFLIKDEYDVWRTLFFSNLEINQKKSISKYAKSFFDYLEKESREKIKIALNFEEYEKCKKNILKYIEC